MPRSQFASSDKCKASAGIPDFRSPKTGLYHNLKRLKLDNPEQVFDIDFFRRKPEPFYELAHELYPGKFAPTKTHSFIRLLHEKSILLRCFTQNIDTLERRAGLPADAIVEAHGSFASNHCINRTCKREAQYESTKAAILKKKIPRCKDCGHLVKPDIVFFGEGLPRRFFERMEDDLPRADLIIVIGTSLQVQPFASLPDMVAEDCPRLLLNLEEIGDFSRELDVVQLIETDRGCEELARLCGWEAELQALDSKIKQEHSPVVDKNEIAKVTPETSSKGEIKAELGDQSLEKASAKVDAITEKLKRTNL